MNQPPVPGWIKTTSIEKVIAPAHGKQGYKIVAEIEVPAWKDPESGEIFLAEEATHKLEEAKARYIGLLCPNQLKELREHHGLTQKRISELLQIGPKSWTRWESGKERPSRAINLLLKSLYENVISLDYLERQLDPSNRVFADQWPLQKLEKRNHPQRRAFKLFETTRSTADESKLELLEVV